MAFCTTQSDVPSVTETQNFFESFIVGTLIQTGYVGECDESLQGLSTTQLHHYHSLYSISCLQVFMYWRRYPRDSIWLKILVRVFFLATSLQLSGTLFRFGRHCVWSGDGGGRININLEHGQYGDYSRSSRKNDHALLVNHGQLRNIRRSRGQWRYD